MLQQLSVTALAVVTVSAVMAAPKPAVKKPTAAPAKQAAAPKPDPRFSEAATVWADIQVQVRDLAEMVREKRLDEIHPVAFEIRDLVRTLPDRSPALPAAVRTRLEGQVRQMDRLAEMLDRYADDGKLDATRRQQTAVLQGLARIKALYPAGALLPPPNVAAAGSKERELYLTPGGIYTQADIQANGNQLPAQRFKGVRVNHDLKPNVGDRICPITLTKANPGYVWTVAGKSYQFCCPPCVEEFVGKAKAGGADIKDPSAYVKK